MTSLTSLVSCLALLSLSNGAAPARRVPHVLKVAMCQIFALDSDREGNFVRIEAALREAREQGAQIACFPETTILGRAADESEWPQHGENLRATVQQAARWMNAPVVGTDLVGAITNGPWKGKTYGGQSTAAAAQGQTLAVAKDRQQDCRVVTLRIP